MIPSIPIPGWPPVQQQQQQPPPPPTSYAPPPVMYSTPPALRQPSAAPSLVPVPVPMMQAAPPPASFAVPTLPRPTITTINTANNTNNIMYPTAVPSYPSHNNNGGYPAIPFSVPSLIPAMPAPTSVMMPSISMPYIPTTTTTTTSNGAAGAMAMNPFAAAAANRPFVSAFAPTKPLVSAFATAPTAPVVAPASTTTSSTTTAAAMAPSSPSSTDGSPVGAATAAPSPDAQQQPTTTTATPEAAAVVEAELPQPRISPDYSLWVHPFLKQLKEGSSTTRVGTMGTLAVPATLAPPPMLAMGLSGDAPTPLDPAFILFGGAKYASFAPMGPKPRKTRPTAATTTTTTTGDAEEDELKRLQFMVDQLKVAKKYLKLEIHRATAAAATTSVEERGVGATYTICGDVEEVAADGDAAGAVSNADKMDVWTAAYFATPQVLREVVSRPGGRERLAHPGHVLYGRRHWGLKRCAESYTLGHGMKATPLQFAAAAGRVDNVVFLLASGAREATSGPTLKELVLPESYQLVQTMLASTSASLQRRKRPAKPSSAEMDVAMPAAADVAASVAAQEGAEQHHHAEVPATAAPPTPTPTPMAVFAPPLMPPQQLQVVSPQLNVLSSNQGI